MADVWIAEDRVLGRRVAVKILHRQFAEDAAFVERFRRESQAAAGLSHPNIVAVHDWGRDGDTYFIVMEFVQGRDLRDLLRSEGALPPRRVAEIGSAVGMALAAAHNQGLVHRDIKPANVLLTLEGAVKVADFGIARADDSEQLTQTGAVIGTAAYFSPEQAEGHPADPRSDIYSLGVVMYELLTGAPPFSGENSLAIAYQHTQRVPEPPSRLRPDVPPGLEAIVLKAMAKDPADRYQTAAEMVEDLDRLRAGETPQAALRHETPTRVMPPVVGLPPMPRRGRDSYDPPQPNRRGPAGVAPRTFNRTALTVGVIAAAALIRLGIFLAVRLAGPGGEGTLVLPEGTGNTTTTVTDPGSSTEPSAADTITLPTVNSPENQTAAAGVSTSFDLGSFNDPGGDDGPWGIEVRWVDGGSFESLGTFDTAGPLGTASHTYASAGSYTVTVRVTDKGSASGVAAFAVAVSASTGTADRATLYLHNDPTPPTGSTNAQQRLPMDNTTPTATTLDDYDADRDDFPGLLIKKGGSEDRYIFPDGNFQNWRYTAPAGGLVLSGNVEVTLFSAMKDFTTDKRGHIQVYLRDCTGNSCTTIASGSLDRRQWNDASGWSEDTILLSGLSYTVAAGRQLELKIVVHDDSDDDMWFAYDTTTHPARLTWTN